jgi:translation elongation factor EF-G
MSSEEMANLDIKCLGKELVSRFGWNPSDAAKIWAAGPEPLRLGDRSNIDLPTCLLVDSTFGLQIPQDARENIIAAFQQVSRRGVLVHAPMRGVRFDLVDAKFHSDSVHRRPNSVVPAASRAMKGAYLMANPRLLEPIYRADISGATGSLNSVYSILGQRNGSVVDTTSTQTTDAIQAYLPVRCAFGLVDVLRRATKGRAHYTSVYSGMSLLPENEEKTVILETRKQKSLGDKLPSPDEYIDKL